jgi:hypothetical protein
MIRLKHRWSCFTNDLASCYLKMINNNLVEIIYTQRFSSQSAKSKYVATSLWALKLTRLEVGKRYLLAVFHEKLGRIAKVSILSTTKLYNWEYGCHDPGNYKLLSNRIAINLSQLYETNQPAVGWYQKQDRHGRVQQQPFWMYNQFWEAVDFD